MKARVLHAARCLAAGAILWAALVRLLSAHSRFPWWEVDPTRQFLPETTLRPSHGLMLDLVVWFASLLGVGACVLMGERLRWRTGVLALIGAGWALVIGMFRVRAGSAADDLSLGSAWAAAMVGAWATTHVARDAAVRAGLIAVLAGAAWTLAFKGGYQVFVEHPMTVAHFKANADALLTAQGIEPGSAGAREFERRLMQAEATGWVGLSNAHASVIGACTLLCIGLAIGGARAARSGQTPGGAAGLLVLGAGVAAAGLVMTGSKGGITSAFVGVMAASAALAVARRSGPLVRVPDRSCIRERRGLAARGAVWLAWLAPVVPLLALAAVVVRGCIGERWGELSLLFRAQYLEGAVRVIAETFPAGAGPGGFKAAYALHKPALSPETVESPHSIFFDWLGCLGLPGAAWCVLLMVWTVRMGRSVCSAVTSELPASSAARSGVLGASSGAGMWLVVPVLACLVAWTREAQTIAPDEYPLRAIGVLAWIAAVACAWRVMHGRAVEVFLFGAGVALVTHAQIEVTAVLPSTAPVALLLMALASSRPDASSFESAGAAGGAPSGSDAGVDRVRRMGVVAWAFALAMLVALFWIGRQLDRVIRWESCLREASEAASLIAEARDQFVRGQKDPRDAADIIRAASEHCVHELSQAGHVRPEILRADEAAARVLVGVAAEMVALRQPEAARGAVARAVAHLEEVETRDGGRCAGLFASTAAGAYQALHALDGNPAWLERAVERWRMAMARDPHALTPVLRCIDALVTLGRVREARPLALQALEIDERLRLDPIKRMPVGVRARLERLAGE